MSVPQTQALVVAQKHAGRLLRQANQIFYLKSIMKPEVHFGKPYPGSKKDTLLKPGAEWLAMRFRMRPEYRTDDKALVIDWQNPEQSYIMYEITCTMIDIATGRKLGDASGSCNSLEEKYRFRWVADALVPSHLDKTKLKSRMASVWEPEFAVSKAETTGKYGKPESYWQRFRDEIEAVTARKTRRKMGNKEYEGWEIGGIEYQVVNENPFDLQNTILKMAQKRALVSAVLVATGASSYFAPGDDAVSDLYMEFDESEVVEGEFEEIGVPDEFPVDEPRSAAPSKPAPPKDNVRTMPQTQPPAQKPAETKPVETAPAAINPAKFLDWTFKNLMLTEKQTLEALEASVNYKVVKIEDFKEANTWAMAAAICFAHENGLKEVERVTSTLPGLSDETRFKVWDAAQEIIKLNTPEEKPAPVTTWTAGDTAAMLAYLHDLFRLDPDTTLEALGKTAWAEFDTLSVAKEAVRGLVIAKGFAMIATKAKWDAAAKFYVLNTPIPVRVYGGDKFRSLGDEWQPLPDEWKKQEGVAQELPRPLVVEWKTGKNGGYYEATELIVITPQDDEEIEF